MRRPCSHLRPRRDLKSLRDDSRAPWSDKTSPCQRRSPDFHHFPGGFASPRDPPGSRREQRTCCAGGAGSRAAPCSRSPSSWPGTSHCRLVRSVSATSSCRRRLNAWNMIRTAPHSATRRLRAGLSSRPRASRATRTRGASAANRRARLAGPEHRAAGHPPPAGQQCPSPRQLSRVR